MAEFRLSERAERDLIEIYDYTEETGFILIRAVLHQAREIKPDLFD